MRLGDDDNLKARLRALPGFEAPAGAWERIAAASTASAATKKRVRPALALAAAAAVAAVAVGLVLRPGTEHATPSRQQVAVRPVSADPLSALQAESARLDALLASLPEQRAMRGSTAYTVATLQDRIAVVDDRLTVAAVEPVAPEHAEQLWRERVELMSSLVNVRYAGAVAR
jgi:hypothetical protein